MFKRWIIVLIAAAAVFIVAASPCSSLDYPPQPAPEMLEVFPLNPPEHAVGRSDYDGYYGDLKWAPLELPNPPEAADRQYINIYAQKVNKPYRPSTGLELMAEGIDGTETQVRMGNLESGTIYYTHAVAYYTDVEGGEVVYTSLESLPSNTVKILTDIDISAVPTGMNEIGITWDDVWNSGGRINYKLYVSESPDFSNTPPIYISPELIGPGRPVSVNEACGKLEYTYRVPDAGRVYYIKVEPDIFDDSLNMSPESPVVMVSSYIIARTVRMASNDMGTIWKMEWSPVITGLDQGEVDITYHIYRGISGSGELPQYVAATDETNFFFTLQEDDPEYYFIIRAIVKQDGEDLYPGITIESMKIEAKESEIPSSPPAPELIETVLDNYGNEITSFEAELEADSATVFWRPPRKGNGDLDSDTSYDIWLLTDPSQLDSPAENTRIATSLFIDENRQVLDGATVRAYKYGIEGLEQNSVYYFRIQARKEFVDYVDGILQNVVYYSEPSIKVIITPADGSIEQPVVPGRPPLTVKKGPPPDERPMVSEDTAVITLKNKWYERYNTEEGRWVNITPDELDGIDETLLDRLESGEYDGNEFRIVQYDEGVTLDLGCIPYQGGIEPEDLETIPADWVTAFPASPNDPLEDPEQNPDGVCHNIDITVSGLEPNTTYILWLRAARQSAGLVSGPSDPIVLTTDPEEVIYPEKPIVPDFSYYSAGDTYIDLGWDFREGYSYNIRCGLRDELHSASETSGITREDLESSLYYRFTELEQDTIYHFWIQAEVSAGGEESMKSEWSSSLVIKTLPYIPPETPGGFGIKSGSDAVTKESITYEWIAVEGLEYILEFADNMDYEDAARHVLENVSEYTVTGLKSNYRYYARLYAYDAQKEKESQPTASVSVKTRKSDDEYDADTDTETYPPPEAVVKEPAAHMGIWTIKVTDTGADVFIEQAIGNKSPDIAIGADEPPEGTRSIRLLIAGRVFDAMSDMGKGLIVDMPHAYYVFRPGCLKEGHSFSPADVVGGVFEIVITPVEENMDIPGCITPSIEPSVLKAELVKEGGGYAQVREFLLPVRMVFKKLGYETGLACMVHDLDNRKWTETTIVYGYEAFTAQLSLYAELAAPAAVTAGIMEGDMYKDIANSAFRASINRIARNYSLKSITGEFFRPEETLMLYQAVKLAFDVSCIDSSGNPVKMAVKSGILDIEDLYSGHIACTREKAMDMLVRLYETSMNTRAYGDSQKTEIFSDMHLVSDNMAENVAFAVENGLVSFTCSGLLNPQQKISRGEFAFLLERYLALKGELY